MSIRRFVPIFTRFGEDWYTAHHLKCGWSARFPTSDEAVAALDAHYLTCPIEVPE